MGSEQTETDPESGHAPSSGLNQPNRDTAYTTVSVPPAVRDDLRALRDESPFDTYGSLFRYFIQNAQEDLSN